MRRNRLNSSLDGMFRSKSDDLACNRALEADLLSRYRKLYPRNRRWLMLFNPWNRLARFALVGLALCLIVVGACTTDTITEVEVGKRMQLDLEPNSEGESTQGKFLFIFEYISPEDVTREARKMSELLVAQPGVEDASVSISQQGDDEVQAVHVDMVAWGEGIDTDGLLRAVQASYPELADAAVTVEDLSAKVEESFATKLGRELLHVEVSGSNREELRQQILEELAAQGFTGDASVHLEMEGDQGTIHIELEE